MINKVRITWNNQAGELDFVEVVDDGELSVTNALIEMIKDSPVDPGDSFTIEEVIES